MITMVDCEGSTSEYSNHHPLVNATCVTGWIVQHRGTMAAGSIGIGKGGPRWAWPTQCQYWPPKSSNS